MLLQITRLKHVSPYLGGHNACTNHCVDDMFGRLINHSYSPMCAAKKPARASAFGCSRGPWCSFDSSCWNTYKKMFVNTHRPRPSTSALWRHYSSPIVSNIVIWFCALSFHDLDNIPVKCPSRGRFIKKTNCMGGQPCDHLDKEEGWLGNLWYEALAHFCGLAQM